MIKPIILLLVFVLCPVLDTPAQRINIGVKGGVNLSNISNSGASGSLFNDSKNKLGLNVYLFSDFYTINDFTLGGEAGYVQKGYRFEVIETNEFGEEIRRGHLNYRLNYISLGLPFKFIYNKGNVNPYAVIFPRVDFYTGYKTSRSDLSTSIGDSPNLVLEDYKKTVFGVTGGAGIEFRGIIPGAILIESRYLFDFTNSYDKNSLKLKNKALEFNIGIKF